MSAPVASRTASWYPPESLAQRGTVVLLPGRGEHPGVYERLGRRLSADAYAVHVLETPDLGQLPPGPAAPLVLAGSDTGALRALAAAADPSARWDGLLLVGTPTVTDAGPVADTPSPGDWEAELAVRTACPAHRGRLAADPGFDRGALAVPVPAELAAAAEAAVPLLGGLPVLLVHGEADAVAPVAGTRALAARLPRAVLATVADGRHDALNDLSHRSVAATVVHWLERLRTGPQLPVLVTVREN
ncbi:alpha/beta hydrolase [Streptacidiphilus cavernicola]|uniref:Alpha/beta hydrolase n=1 Tax=Streptacidiphilus cavernicola TaxID=3342716 RepID=A0ABV6VPW8_9ACTN